MTRSKEKVLATGTVVEALPGTRFLVELDSGHQVLPYLSGKMRQHYIRILLGDRVDVELSQPTWSEGESCTGTSASRFRPSHVERSSNLYEEVQTCYAR